MKRKTLINLHLYFSGVSLFLLLLFIASGSLHLFGVEEGESKVLIEQIEIQGITNKVGLEKFFLAYLKDKKPGYSFDYTKGDDTSLITRPTTRTYYRIKYDSKMGLVEISEHVPNINKRFMEFHKGHGPKVARKIVACIALIFALAILTGLWLGLSVKAYRRITLACSATSLLIVLVLFNL